MEEGHARQQKGVNSCFKNIPHIYYYPPNGKILPKQLTKESFTTWEQR